MLRLPFVLSTCQHLCLWSGCCHLGDGKSHPQCHFCFMLGQLCKDWIVLKRWAVFQQGSATTWHVHIRSADVLWVVLASYEIADRPSWHAVSLARINTCRAWCVPAEGFNSHICEGCCIWVVPLAGRGGCSEEVLIAVNAQQLFCWLGCTNA
jgi:hypothetical protein